MIEGKSFESFIILFGLFLVLIEFYNFNSNLGFCIGNSCVPKVIHYLIVVAGIALVVWGVLLLNPQRKDEWLGVDWEE